MLRHLLTLLLALQLALAPMARAGVTSTVTGAEFGDAFRGSFISSVVALGLADVQTGIGDVFNDANGNPINGGEGSLGHVLLHGLAGCVAAEAQGADCRSGAVGGIAGAIYSGSLDGTTLSSAQQRQQMELIGLAVGWMFSGGDAANVSTTNSTATSALVNNRQLHVQEANLIRENAADFAQANGISVEEAVALLTAAALDQVDAMFRVDDRSAKFQAAVAYLDRLGRGQPILGTSQTLFQATEVERC